jgi:hypothetical protein
MPLWFPGVLLLAFVFGFLLFWVLDRRQRLEMREKKRQLEAYLLEAEKSVIEKTHGRSEPR